MYRRQAAIALFCGIMRWVYNVFSVSYDVRQGMAGKIGFEKVFRFYGFRFLGFKDFIRYLRFLRVFWYKDRTQKYDPKPKGHEELPVHILSGLPIYN